MLGRQLWILGILIFGKWGICLIKRNIKYEDLENGVSDELIRDVMAEHLHNLDRFQELDRYYKGKHGILKREAKGDGRPNVKVVHAFPKYIVTMTTGYLLGDKIKYSSKTLDISGLVKIYQKGRFWESDEEIAKDMGVFGVGYELLYMSDENVPMPKSFVIDPRNAFVVGADTAGNRKMLGIYYYLRCDGLYKTKTTVINVYTDKILYVYETQGHVSGNMELTLVDAAEHHFCEVPIIEYQNNEEAKGDFEDVLSLVDAYNQLQSDRVNDVERFVQAILFLKNFRLDEGDAAVLKDKRILQAVGDRDVDAKWLVNALDQNGSEILRQTLEQDLHKFSFVPSMNDANFASNVSGVAMKYKLIGLSQMNKIKKRYMEKGLRDRLRLVLAVPNWVNNLDESEIDINFSHSLPINDLEVAQMVKTLENSVSSRTLLGQLSFVADPEAEAISVAEEKGKFWVLDKE